MFLICRSFQHMNSTRSLFHDNNREKPVRYAVSSLGWVPIAEEDLTPERSNKAVNKCIVDLTLGRNDINDVVGRWGDVSILLVFILLLFIPCHFKKCGVVCYILMHLQI